MVKNPPANSIGQVDPWGGKIPWRRRWPPTPVFLPGKFQEERICWVTVHRVAKTRIRLSVYSGNAVKPYKTLTSYRKALFTRIQEAQKSTSFINMCIIHLTRQQVY